MKVVFYQILQSTIYQVLICVQGGIEGGGLGINPPQTHDKKYFYLLSRKNLTDKRW